MLRHSHVIFSAVILAACNPPSLERLPAGVPSSLPSASPTASPTPEPVGCAFVPKGKFRACYYDGIDFTNLKLYRDVDQVDFSWGESSPDPAIAKDSFSATYRGIFDFSAGNHDFTLAADDGVRLSIDGSVILDDWSDHSVRENVVRHALTAGPHEVRVDYYENSVHASVRLHWTQSCEAVGSERFGACYYDNADFSNLKTVREEARIDFDWGEGSPVPGVEAETFSAIYQGDFTFDDGLYAFTVGADDGVRLTVDGEKISEDWSVHAYQEQTVRRRLSAGVHRIRVDYYENTGGAAVRLSWASVPFGRTGLVRLENASAVDDGGAFNALGATLFWAPWGYKFDRQRLERNLAALSNAGYDYIRVFGQVGCTGNDPFGSSGPMCSDGHRNWWNGRVISHLWPDYDQVIADVTDLAYDKYGLRVEWTVFASGDQVGNKRALLDRFLAMSRGREQKIMHFEIANEGFWTGMGSWEGGGKEAVRELAKYMNDRTAIPIATTTPGTDGDYCADSRDLNTGVADMATIHYPRDGEGGWRPVRITWDNCPDGVRATSSNEPIGPGSSVATASDPYQLVAAAINAYISKVGFYVYHTEAGVWGGLYTDEGGHSPPGTGKSNVDEYPTTNIVPVLKSYVPIDLASWTRYNVLWGGYPFEIGGDPSAFGDFQRAYASRKGNEFVVMPIGLRGRFTMRAKYAMSFDVYHLLTGQVIQTHNLRAGESITLVGEPAYFIKGVIF